MNFPPRLETWLRLPLPLFYVNTGSVQIGDAAVELKTCLHHVGHSAQLLPRTTTWHVMLCGKLAFARFPFPVSSSCNAERDSIAVVVCSKIICRCFSMLLNLTYPTPAVAPAHGQYAISAVTPTTDCRHFAPNCSRWRTIMSTH